MNIWPRFLRFLWEEEEATRAPAPIPGAGTPREVTGVPVFLRKVTRWSVIATVGATLTAQIIGVRLLAPVDAHDQVYKLACSCCCLELRKLCETQTAAPGPGALCPKTCRHGAGDPTPWPSGTLGGQQGGQGQGGGAQSECNQFAPGTKERIDCCKRLETICLDECPES